MMPESHHVAARILSRLMQRTAAQPGTQAAGVLLPPGISLPFFSYGGTSLVMLLAQMGIVLSISRQMKKSGGSG